MFAQYVVGPAYTTYPAVLPLHRGLFVLGGVLLVWAWARVRAAPTPSTTRRRQRVTGVAVLLFGAFISLRYVPAAANVATGAPLSAENAADPAMYWSIVLLDLSVVVPVTVAVGVGLRRGTGWAWRAVYGLVGWYVLVPVSVAAMSLAMLLDGDLNAAVGTVVVLAVAALLFTLVAAWLYRPLVERNLEGQSA
jgi:hypothetical protein